MRAGALCLLLIELVLCRRVVRTQYVCFWAAVDTQKAAEELEINSVNMKHISSKTGGNDT